MSKHLMQRFSVGKNALSSRMKNSSQNDETPLGYQGPHAEKNKKMEKLVIIDAGS